MNSTKNESAIVAFAIAVSLIFPGFSFAQQTTHETITEKLKEISRACEDQGKILAEARINKWKKVGQDVREKFGENAFEIISKVMHQQCVSIQHVALLRLMKSHISTEEAARLSLDREIAKQMDIIERTL